MMNKGEGGMSWEMGGNRKWQSMQVMEEHGRRRGSWGALKLSNRTSDLLGLYDRKSCWWVENAKEDEMRNEMRWESWREAVEALQVREVVAWSNGRATEGERGGQLETHFKKEPKRWSVYGAEARENSGILGFWTEQLSLFVHSIGTLL